MRSTDGDTIKATYLSCLPRRGGRCGFVVDDACDRDGRDWWLAPAAAATCRALPSFRSCSSEHAATLRVVTAVLFTCAGQRVDIVSAFGRAGATTVAADVDPLAPALYHADHRALVPRVDDPGYVAGARRGSSPSTTSGCSCR